MTTVTTRKDCCWDWPVRPQLRGAPAPTAQDAGATVPWGGEVWHPLLFLAALPVVAYSFLYCASVLIDLLNRAPLLGVIAGTSLLFGGVLGWALCKAAAEPWYLEDDEQRVTLPSGLMGVRFE